MTKTLQPDQDSAQSDPVQTAGERVKLRGRPRKEQAGMIDADILKAAIAVFDEVGFAAAAMETIAARAGISKRTLYMRYPDKKALFKEIIVSIVANSRQPDPPSFPSMEACLFFHVDNFFMICNDPGMRVLMALNDKAMLDVPEISSMAEEMTYDLGIRHIVQTIEETAGRTGMTVHEPAFYAAALLDLAMAHYQRYRVLGASINVATPELASRRIVGLLLAGMNANVAASD